MTNSKVTLTIGDRAFAIACEEGQEKHVEMLGQYIDQKMREIMRNGIGSANESYQWLMVALLITDELSTAKQKLDSVQMDTTQYDARAQRQSEIDIEAVRHLSHRIEELAQKLTAE